MLEIADRKIGARLAFAPLPPHPTPSELLADALPLLRPASGVSVTEACERHLRVQAQGAWQPYSRETVPYMVEPQDMTMSRLYNVVAVTAPSQSGKTTMLQATALHRVMEAPMPVLLLHMTRASRDKWVEEKFNPTIQNSPSIRARLGPGRDDDTFSRKRFQGMRIAIDYPTPTSLSGDTRGLVLGTDYDHWPQAIGPKDRPEGTPLSMARQRVKTWFSRGCVLLESSIAYPQADPSWHPDPKKPHMLPPTGGGIVSVYNDGTRARWHWTCPDCDELFEPRFDRLHFDAEREPAEAASEVYMQCPECGSLIEERLKPALNRAGVWLHETDDGRRVPIDHPDVRKSEIVSYALNGAAAVFARWPEMVEKYLSAVRTFRDMGDDLELGSVFYTDIGLPFLRPNADGDSQIGLQFLKDHAQEAERGVAPSWTRFITVSVDVQATRFVVQVTAWGPEAQSQVVDRFDLITPPESAPGRDADGDTRALSPARYEEDWAVLAPLGAKVWPVAGQRYGLRALAAVVDFHGEPGVSDNAEKFWRQRRRDGEAGFWFVSRGHGGIRLPMRVWYETPERGSKGKKARAIRILNFATDRLKDTVFAALGKAAEQAAGALYLPRWMVEKDSEHLAEEFLAEGRDEKKGWQKLPGKVRNESLDLSAMARALAEHKGMLRVDWSAPPPWAVGGPSNTAAVPDDAPPAPETERGDAAPQDKSSRAAPRIGYFGR